MLFVKITQKNKTEFYITLKLLELLCLRRAFFHCDIPAAVVFCQGSWIKSCNHSHVWLRDRHMCSYYPCHVVSSNNFVNGKIHTCTQPSLFTLLDTTFPFFLIVLPNPEWAESTLNVQGGGFLSIFKIWDILSNFVVVIGEPNVRTQSKELPFLFLFNKWGPGLWHPHGTTAEQARPSATRFISVSLDKLGGHHNIAHTSCSRGRKNHVKMPDEAVLSFLRCKKRQDA